MRLKKVIFLFNIIVSSVYILFMKVQLNPFQVTLIIDVGLVWKSIFGYASRLFIIISQVVSI